MMVWVALGAIAAACGPLISGAGDGYWDQRAGIGGFRQDSRFGATGYLVGWCGYTAYWIPLRSISSDMRITVIFTLRCKGSLLYGYLYEHNRE
jgi:hypothetical protein